VRRKGQRRGLNHSRARERISGPKIGTLWKKREANSTAEAIRLFDIGGEEEKDLGKGNKGVEKVNEKKIWCRLRYA